jgi:hypothetical protein
MHDTFDDPLSGWSGRRFVAVATFVLVGALAACSSSAATGSPTSAASPAATGAAAPTTIASAIPSALPAPSATPTDVNTTPDPSGDATPDYLDIVRLRADAASGDLTLALDLAGAVPPGSPAVGQLAYTYSIDVDGDGTPDYAVALTLLPGGGFQPSLTDLRTGARLEGSAYPGSATTAGRSITITLRLDAIRCPTSLHLRAASVQTKGGVRSGDSVPDASTDWIQVATDCPTPS